MVAPTMTRAAAFANGTPVALDTNGTVREARGLASRTYSTSETRAYCTLSSPRTPTPRAMASVDRRTRSISSRPSVTGGITHAESPEWMPGLLDVLHHPAEVELGAVEERVDVDLDGVVEEPVDQHRVLRRHRGGDGGEPLAQLLVVEDDRIPAATEHVRRPDQDGVADRVGHRARLVVRRRGAVLRRGSPASPSTRRTRPGPRRDGWRRRASRRSARRRPAAGGEAERCLAAELDDHADDLAGATLGRHDLETSSTVSGSK
jgi:hypothetical protein